MRGILFLVAALALSGCMVGPDYQRPDTGMPAAFSETTVANGAVSVPAQWWTLYADETLNGLVQAGLQNNTDVRVAIARVEEAEAALREARATLFFPLVDANAGATRSRSISQGQRVLGNNFTLGASTSFEVDLWGRLRRAERATRDQLAASRYGRDTVAITLAATIARAYFAVRSLDSQIEASRSIEAATSESLALAQRRADGGVASELDVYQAGGAQTAASAQTKEFTRQRAAFVHQLGVLTGRLDLGLAPASLDKLPIPPLPPEGLPLTLLERRPDLRQAEAELDAATQLVGFARGSQFPTLTLTGSGGVQSAALSSLFSSGSNVWSIEIGRASCRERV